MLALAETCFEGMGPVSKGVEVLALGETCFQGIRAVEEGVPDVETG